MKTTTSPYQISVTSPAIAEAREMRPARLERQAHGVAAVILLSALLLSIFVAPGWIYLMALPIFGLSLDAVTGFCPMVAMLKKMPWNKN